MKRTACLNTAALTLIAGSVACTAEVENVAELQTARQNYVLSINGLSRLGEKICTSTTCEGIPTQNGLRPSNHLSSVNGLTTINGETALNGLKTFKRSTTEDGLPVDCSGGKTAGVDCTGEPDGLLSASLGLMSSDDGIATAKYVVKCALAASDHVTVRDYTGATVTFSGEIGLAPYWGTQPCGRVCQEKVSACLLSMMNGEGPGGTPVHRDVELSAHYADADGSETGLTDGTAADDGVLTIGTGHSARTTRMEGAFYGNLFAEPGKAVATFCTPTSASAAHPVPGLPNFRTLVEARVCGGYAALGLTCPIEYAGSCDAPRRARCSVESGAATSCKDSGVLGIVGGDTWSYPMTIWL